ncbi:MAG TPA: nuclear transport factor 2 family protein [Acidimicrobiia bacterium]|nr:nuclear transport factor 2 family protein [Acidimicrobiia bacterium]
MNAHPCHRAPRRGRAAVVLAAPVLLLVGVPFALSAVPAGAAEDADTSKGTELVQRFFDLLQAGNVAGLGKLLSPAFQIQGADGGYLTKQRFLANPSKVASYTLSNVRATRAGAALVVGYDVAAVVTINGVQLARDPAPRLSVFIKGKNGWQLLAHANFNVAAAQPPESRGDRAASQGAVSLFDSPVGQEAPASGPIRPTGS